MGTLRNNLKAVLVDDDRLSLLHLRKLLQAYEHVEIIGKAATADEAQILIKARAPDVVFLDIQMPGKSGFELVSQLPAGVQIIFVTSHDEYACRAFEVNALDYLVKPVKAGRLGETIRRLCEKGYAPTKTGMKSMRENDLVYLHLEASQLFIRAGDITCIQCHGNKSRIRTRDGRQFIVRRSLNKWESYLHPDNFFRINRTVIINLDCIRQLKRHPTGAVASIEGDEAGELQISRRRASDLRRKLSARSGSESATGR